MRQKTLSFLACNAILCLALLAAAITAPPAQAAFPERDIRLIQPYPPGGSIDLMGRKLADLVGQMNLLPKTVIFVSMPGAHTRTAQQAVLTSPPDGHTLFIHHTAMLTAAATKQVPTNYTDYDLVGEIAIMPGVLEVRADSPWKTPQDMVKAIKENPGKYQIAIPGVGGWGHLLALHFFKAAGIPLDAVRYLPLSGSADTLASLLGGNVDFRSTDTGSAIRTVESGDTRLLLLLDTNPLAVFKDAPNLTDLGLTEYLTCRFGIFAPKGTPKETLAILEKAFKTAVESKEYQEYAATRAAVATFVGPEGFKKNLDADMALLNQIVSELPR